jgi:hypothetical protein
MLAITSPRPPPQLAPRPSALSPQALPPVRDRPYPHVGTEWICHKKQARLHRSPEWAV